MKTVLPAHQPGESSDQFKSATTKEPVGDGSHASCSAWELLGKRWTFQIIAQLLARSQSFQELVTHIQGISEKMLSERLKELDREGVIRRQVQEKRPIRVTYHLTEKGEALEPVIRAICVWSQCL
jgi:DNA-binding HxlR family transcriptional regulator